MRRKRKSQKNKTRKQLKELSGRPEIRQLRQFEIRQLRQFEIRQLRQFEIGKRGVRIVIWIRR
jgi:hypothetical protein